MTEETLSNLLKEDRRFEPPAELAADANLKAEAYERAGSGPGGVLGRAGRAAVAGPQKWDRVLDWDDPPFAKWFVGGKLNAAYNCVDRHVEAGNGDKVAFHWVGEPRGRHPRPHLRRAEGRGVPGGQRADRPRGRGRRPGRDLHADDPRGDRRDAGLRADRRPAHRGVRRLLLRRAGHPARRLPGEGRRHLRRRLPPRLGVGAQAGGRRGADQERRRRHEVEKVLVVRRTGQDVEWDDEVDVWWHDAVDGASDRAHPGGVRRRAPALRHVHLGHHRQAEGHPAHHGRLPRRVRRTPTGRSSTSSRRPTSTGAPPTSAGSPATATSSTGRWPTARRRCSTRAPRTAPSAAAGGRSSRTTRSRSSTPRPTAIRSFMKQGQEIPDKLRHVARCGCSARSVSRSTRRPTSGTATSSAATAPRSSTPGGRPRPARS